MNHFIYFQLRPFQFGSCLQGFLPCFAKDVCVDLLKCLSRRVSSLYLSELAKDDCANDLAEQDHLLSTVCFVIANLNGQIFV